VRQLIREDVALLQKQVLDMAEPMSFDHLGPLLALDRIESEPDFMPQVPKLPQLSIQPDLWMVLLNQDDPLVKHQLFHDLVADPLEISIVKQVELDWQHCFNKAFLAAHIALAVTAICIL
jgi:hypothetical protein